MLQTAVQPSSSCQWVVEPADMIIMIMLADNVTRIMRNIQQLFIGHAHTPISLHSFMSRPYTRAVSIPPSRGSSFNRAVAKKSTSEDVEK